MSIFFYNTIIYPIEIIIELVYAVAIRIVNQPVFAIIAVSLTVNLFCLPLYNIAEKLQKKEHDKQNSMKKQIDRIKTVFKGDEQYMILNTFYKQNHYHPIFALRSTVSLLIQVPFFIAAYNYLSNLGALQGISFLFIKDMGKPDAFFSIGSLIINILPIAMTIINIISGAIYTKSFPIKEKIQLYAMSLLFLVLLYNSPSGLVLYWTLNNLFSLGKNIFNKSKNPKKLFYIISVSLLTVFLCYFCFFTDKTKIKKILVVCLTLLIVAIPLYIKFAHFLISKPLSKLNSNKKERNRLFLYTVVSLFLLCGAVIPISLISSSPQEFSFIDNFTNPLSLVLFPLLQSAGVFLFWCTALYLLFSDHFKTIFTFLLSVLLFVSLINAFIAVGSYGTISNMLKFDSGLKMAGSVSSLLISSVIIIFSFIAILLLYKQVSLKFLLPLPVLISFSFLLMIFINIGTISKSYNQYKDIRATNNAISSTEKIYHFSKTEKNVVIFMLDRAINLYTPYIFNNSQKVRNSFDGFTLYSNTLSFNGHTMEGTPPLFGGYDFTPLEINKRSELSLIEKHTQALSTLPRLFSENGFLTTITDASWANYSWIPDNSIFSPLTNVNALNLEGTFSNKWKDSHGFPVVEQSVVLKRNLLFFSFFRMIPDVLRGALYDNGTWWNTSVKPLSCDNYINSYSALYYINEITDCDSSQPGCNIIVNNNTHDNIYLQYPDYKPVVEVTDMGPNPFEGTSSENDELSIQVYHTNISTYLELASFFDYLKQNEVYDNTRIILVSDHAYNVMQTNYTNGYDVDSPQWFNPLLLVKDFNSHGSLVKDESFMTNADVPYLSCENLIDNPLNPYTNTPLTKEYAEIQKGKGVIIDTGHNITPEQHKKNTLIYGDLYCVNDNIYIPENWHKVE